MWHGFEMINDDDSSGDSDAERGAGRPHDAVPTTGVAAAPGCHGLQAAAGVHRRSPDHRRTAPRWTGGWVSSSGGFRSSCAHDRTRRRASIAFTTGYAETSPAAPTKRHRAARATSICMTPQSSTSTKRHRPSYYCVSQAALA